MPENMDDDVKVQQYYDGNLIRKYVAYFEMFAELMNDTTLSEQKHKIVVQLFNHYRRMVVCMIMKQIPTDFHTNDVLRLRDIFTILNDKEDIRQSKMTIEMFGLGVVGFVLGLSVGMLHAVYKTNVIDKLKVIEDNMIRFEEFKREIESRFDDGK